MNYKFYVNQYTTLSQLTWQYKTNLFEDVSPIKKCWCSVAMRVFGEVNPLKPHLLKSARPAAAWRRLCRRARSKASLVALIGKIIGDIGNGNIFIVGLFCSSWNIWENMSSIDYIHYKYISIIIDNNSYNNNNNNSNNKKNSNSNHIH